MFPKKQHWNFWYHPVIKKTQLIKHHSLKCPTTHSLIIYKKFFLHRYYKKGKRKGIRFFHHSHHKWGKNTQRTVHLTSFWFSVMKAHTKHHHKWDEVMIPQWSYRSELLKLCLIFYSTTWSFWDSETKRILASVFNSQFSFSPSWSSAIFSQSANLFKPAKGKGNDEPVQWMISTVKENKKVR